MTREGLILVHRDYIRCLNSQDCPRLPRYVAEAVEYNGTLIGLAGYRTLLMRDFGAIPDLAFNVARLACDPPFIACRLVFDCAPVGRLFDLPVDGRRVRFDENVFYEYEDSKIAKVWSVIDKATIAAEMRVAGDDAGH